MCQDHSELAYVLMLWGPCNQRKQEMFSAEDIFGRAIGLWFKIYGNLDIAKLKEYGNERYLLKKNRYNRYLID